MEFPRHVLRGAAWKTAIIPTFSPDFLEGLPGQLPRKEPGISARVPMCEYNSKYSRAFMASECVCDDKSYRFRAFSADLYVAFHSLINLMDISTCGYESEQKQ